MLRFFEKYQKGFYFFVAILMIASFAFFGTFETFFEGAERQVPPQAQMAQLLLSREEIVRDLVGTGAAEEIVRADFEGLKEELGQRLDRAKRYPFYSHPEAPQLNATLVWARYFPAMLEEVEALRQEAEATPEVFVHLARLYQQQQLFPPELLRQCLVQQQRQQGMRVDPALAHVDLSLFGFRSIEEWFGRGWIDRAAQVILRGAETAEAKGYRVSLEEAAACFGSGDQEMGRKVLLFQRYVRGLGDAVLLEAMPYREFASYALETAVLERYRWPLRQLLQSERDWKKLAAYVRAVSPDQGKWPMRFYAMEEVERRFPALVQATYRARVGQVSKKEVLLRASLKEVWEWELAHWDQLRKKFARLPDAKAREERFAALEAIKSRAEIDQWVRERLLEERPEWVEEALAAAPLQERIFCREFASDGEVFYRMEDMEQIAERHILTFEEARREGVLEGKEERSFDASALYEAVKRGTWSGPGDDPIARQFQFERQEQKISKSEDPTIFTMQEGEWSPLDSESVSFFCLRDKQSGSELIDRQMAFGQEILSAELQRVLVKKLLERQE